MKLALGALVLLLAAGCGGGSSSHADAKAKAAASASASAAAAAKARAAKAAADFADCNSTFGPLINALTTLQSKVSIGLTFADFNHGLGNVQVVFDRVSRKVKADPALQSRIHDSPCLKLVATPLTQADEAWANTLTTWNKCLFQDPYCDPNKGATSDKIGRGLGRGSTFIDKAVAGMNKLRPVATAGANQS